MLAQAFSCAAFAGAAGCANLWGFEDAVDVRDGDPAEPLQGACTCVASAPDGWRGPLEIYEGSGDAPGPSCGSDYATEGYLGFASPGAPPATCTCSCGPPTTACAPPFAAYFRDGMCTESCSAPPQAIGAACTALNAGGDCKGGGTHFTLSAGAALPGGRCAPVATQAITKVTWGSRAHLCAPSPPVAGTCKAGDVCAPETDPGFEPATRCVVREGEWPCPQGYPSGRSRYYASETDSRTCGPCACGAPAGVACENATATLYTSPMCSAAGSAVSTSPGCSPLQAMTSAALTTGVAPSAGQCVPAGGQPSGGVTPIMPSTLCCTP